MTDKIKSNTEAFHDYGLYLPRRTVEIFGEITEEKAFEVIKNLHSLDNQTGKINVLMSTEGGCFRSGLAIYDAIKGCKNYVRAMVFGQCMSAGTFILQAADERFASPNSLFMIHYGSYGRPDDNAINQERWNEQEKKDKKTLEELYYQQIKKKHPKFARNRLRKLLEFDTIYNAEEFKEFGLLDGVIEQYE